MNSLLQGFNWLVSPPSSSPPSPSGSYFSNSTHLSNTHTYHCPECALRSRIEHETSKQVHGFLKSMCKDLRTHTQGPVDVVMYCYESGSFSRPNGYIYMPDNDARVHQFPKTLFCAVLVIADDPLHEFDYRNKANYPQLQRYLDTCIEHNKCHAVLVTNYHRWLFLQYEQEEAKLSSVRSTSSPASSHKRFSKSSSSVSVPSDSLENQVHRNVLKVTDGRLDSSEYVVHRNLVKTVRAAVKSARRKDLKVKRHSI